MVQQGQLLQISSLFLCALTSPVAVHFCVFVPFGHRSQPFLYVNHVQVDKASTFFLQKGSTFLCTLYIKMTYGTMDGLVL